jgi:sugar phosphate isomerase/epimerase
LSRTSKGKRVRLTRPDFISKETNYRIHIHDVTGFEDHLAPGQGEIAYQEIKPFLRSSMIKILELNASRVKREDLSEGIRLVRTSGL